VSELFKVALRDGHLQGLLLGEVLWLDLWVDEQRIAAAIVVVASIVSLVVEGAAA
jgi:hypothetical protein